MATRTSATIAPTIVRAPTISEMRLLKAHLLEELPEPLDLAAGPRALARQGEPGDGALDGARRERIARRELAVSLVGRALDRVGAVELGLHAGARARGAARELARLGLERGEPREEPARAPGGVAPWRIEVAELDR